MITDQKVSPEQLKQILSADRRYLPLGIWVPTAALPLPWFVRQILWVLSGTLRLFLVPACWLVIKARNLGEHNERNV